MEKQSKMAIFAHFYDNTFTVYIYPFILCLVILFGTIEYLPDVLLLSQAKELLQLFMTTTFGLMAMFIAFVFSAFNTKEPSILKFLTQKRNGIMLIGSLIIFSIIMSFFMLSLLIITQANEIKSSLILFPMISLIFSLIYVISTAVTLITATLRSKRRELIGFPLEELKTETKRKN